MEVLKKLLELLLNPFFLCIFLLFLMLVFWKRISSLRLYQLTFGLFLVLLLLSTGILPCFLTTNLEAQYPVVEKVDQNVRWVVVLGGGQSNATAMSAANLLTSASLKRLLEGVRLLQKLPKAKIILSGGSSFAKTSEAKLMYQTSDLLALSKENIVLETKSVNTEQQAKNIQKILGTQRFYLVTSASHMPRAMALCKKYGLNPIAAPTDFTLFWSTHTYLKTLVPNAYNLSYFSIAYHEILGRIWRFV